MALAVNLGEGIVDELKLGRAGCLERHDVELREDVGVGGAVGTHGTGTLGQNHGSSTQFGGHQTDVDARRTTAGHENDLTGVNSLGDRFLSDSRDDVVDRDAHGGDCRCLRGHAEALGHGRNGRFRVRLLKFQATAEEV